MWDVITQPCPNVNSGWIWVSLPHNISRKVLTYPCPNPTKGSLVTKFPSNCITVHILSYHLYIGPLLSYHSFGEQFKKQRIFNDFHQAYKMVILYATEWISSDGRSIFLDDVRWWISTLRVQENLTTMTSQCQCLQLVLRHNTKLGLDVLGKNGGMSCLC